MDEATLHRLQRQGAIVRLPTGNAGVRVSLRYLRSMVDRPRAERKELLASKLRELADAVGHQGGAIDEQTVSVSGQVCEAVLPLDGYEALKADVEAKDFEVQPLFDRQVL